MQGRTTKRCTHNKIVVTIGTNLLADKVKGINLDPMNEISRNATVRTLSVQ